MQQHYDNDTLALLALGESGVTADEGYHFKFCGQCRNEVDQLARVVRVGRNLSAETRLEQPPARVWDRITTELSASDGTGPGLTGPVVVPNPPSEEVSTADGEPVAAEVAQLSSATSHTAKRRRRMNPALLAVAAALVGVLVGTLATLGVTQRPTTPSAPVSQNIARTVLYSLDARAAHGTAVVSMSQDQRTLTVSVEGLPATTDGFYEVWLMNAEPQRLISLGVLDLKHNGVFQIPAGLKLSNYPVVDISLQPFNGSSQHSGISSVRGTLNA
jgi:hypothetical protein